jgi:hypothetical protein
MWIFLKKILGESHGGSSRGALAEPHPKKLLEKSTIYFFYSRVIIIFTYNFKTKRDAKPCN